VAQLVDRGPPEPLAAVYVHIPFCWDRCIYCAFPTVGDDLSLHAPLVEALVEEARRAAPTAPLRSLYLGGGTPGLLEPQLLQTLLEGLRRHAPLAPGSELTLEANPANVRRETLGAWAELGINRLSVGVQSFVDGALAGLGRRHDAACAHRALQLIAEHWTDSWSADLLVGWKGQRLADVRSDVENLLAYAPPHVSVYGLTIEPRTAMARLQAAGRTMTAPEALAPAFDRGWAERLAAAGYARYEASNFARPGHRSRHNQAYWSNASYLGLGPGASSSLHPWRWTNRRSPTAYCRAVLVGHGVREMAERITPWQRLLESLAVGLRTADGLAVEALDRRFSPAWRPLVRAAAHPLIDAGLLSFDERRLCVPPPHLVRVDRILTELIFQLDDHGHAQLGDHAS
jgi:oxygen-independent coproporphyrinogen-3 oxidase